ncbi:hypothetical protein MEEL106852_01960 [Megasphaera elsdenii]|uniref:Uncharacterized protein n=1 Tax=Megasphaera elsdenii DSM 20460 TaxID=1064535 RepID=G0VQD5_MEGEL|nr:hypothetical protein MELS_1442 [Megasphaera elsdenii DSM 20460]SHK26977.1 hypothetical protein SAMN04488492_109131 [Megasphaera elsdenii]
MTKVTSLRRTMKMNRGFRRAALWDGPYEAVCGPP